MRRRGCEGRALSTVIPGQREALNPESIGPHASLRNGFRVQPCGLPRNDGGERAYNPNTIFATMSRWISEEPPKIV